MPWRYQCMNYTYQQAKHVWNLRYTVRNQCIHCNLTSHESGNHHLSLGIFYVPGDPPHIHCLAPKENDIATMGTPDLGNSVSDKKEQSMTQNKHPTTEYLCNGNQVARLPCLLPMTSMPSMATPASSRFTTSSWTSCTTNHTFTLC